MFTSTGSRVGKRPACCKMHALFSFKLDTKINFSLLKVNSFEFFICHMVLASKSLLLQYG